MPLRHRELAGDDGGAAAVALFQDFEEIVTGLIVERLEPPIIEDQELAAAECAQQPGIAAVTASEREIAEQLGHPLVEGRGVVAASFVAGSASGPCLSDAGGPGDDQIVVSVDPVADDQLLEEGAIDTAGRTVVDILDRRLVTQ